MAAANLPGFVDGALIRKRNAERKAIFGASPVVADGGDAALVQTKFRATSSSVTSSAGRLYASCVSRHGS